MRNPLLFSPLLLALLASGCRSSHIDVDVENHTGQPVKLLEVDYPTASFGTDAIAAGNSMHYRIQVRGSGQVKVQFTSGDGHVWQTTGPSLSEGQQGRLDIELLPGGKSQFHPALTQK